VTNPLTNYHFTGGKTMFKIIGTAVGIIVDVIVAKALEDR